MDLLLVEDEPAVAELYRPHLERAGWRVDWMTTVGSATAAAMARPYDIVVLDILLKEPGQQDGDGLDVLRAMRAQGIGTPVVICSSYGSERLATDLGAEFGVLTMLAKPIDIKTLLMSLAAAAAAARGPRDALSIVEAELARVDFSLSSAGETVATVLLRALGDRNLFIVPWVALCEGVARCTIAGSPLDAESLGGLLAAARAGQGLAQVPTRILSVLMNCNVPNEAELARLCDLSVKATRKALIDCTGHGFSWWRRMSRLRRFVIALLTTTERTTQCAHRAGYPEAKHAWRDSRDIVGLTADRIRGIARPKKS